VFVPGKPFQPSLMFAGKAGAYPIEALAYYENLLSTAVKSFIVQSPRVMPQFGVTL
jgi:hypothetical protein